MLWSGSRYGIMSLGHQALERGGDSPEGALGPRARRRFTRGALGPRARQSLSGVAPSPRARRKLTRGVPRPIDWWAVVASLCRGPFHFRLRLHRACFWGSRRVHLCFIIFSKRGFSPVIRGPLWLSPTSNMAFLLALGTYQWPITVF
jgi:hypothetical protein